MSYLKGGKYTYKPPTGFRSGLEQRVAKQIADAKYTASYEQNIIKYTVPAKVHTYTPDFILSNGIIVETKGIFEPQDRQKHLHIKKQYPHLDIRFVFSNPNNKITKGSQTTYGKWCDKNGFKYSTKTIPNSWFTEPPKDLTGVTPKKQKGDKTNA